METTDFQDILEEAADSVTALDPANLDDSEFKSIRRSAARRLETAWEYHFWPDLMRVEQRFFRAPYDDDTEYSIGDEVYFPATRKYYLNLLPISASGTAPATLTNGEYVVNKDTWIESSVCYSGEDFDSDTTYASGDIARNPDDGLFYQRISAGTGFIISGAGVESINGDWYVSGTTGGKPSYSKLNGNGETISYQSGFWIIATADEAVYTSSENVATPDLVSDWGSPPNPVFGTSGDITHPLIWSRLTPFDRYVAYEQDGKTEIGSVAALYMRNPYSTTRNLELPFLLSADGVQVTSAVTCAWIQFRLRCPKLTGEVFSATAIYTSGKQVYFSDDDTRGNFYAANTTTTAGDSPSNAPSKWDVVEIPRIFHRYLAHGIAADWILGPGGGAPDDAALENAQAQEELDNQKSLLVGQQSQRIQTVVRTR